MLQLQSNQIPNQIESLQIKSNCFNSKSNQIKFCSAFLNSSGQNNREPRSRPCNEFLGRGTFQSLLPFQSLRPFQSSMTASRARSHPMTELSSFHFQSSILCSFLFFQNPHSASLDHLQKIHDTGCHDIAHDFDFKSSTAFSLPA